MTSGLVHAPTKSSEDAELTRRALVTLVDISPSIFKVDHTDIHRAAIVIFWGI